MAEKPRIQLLAEEMAEARGYEYQLAYNALKGVIEEIDLDTFRGEIARFTNSAGFRQLFAVGLSRIQQLIVTERWKELDK